MERLESECISNKYIQIEIEDYKHAKVLIDKRKKLQQDKGDYMSKVSDALLVGVLVFLGCH